jgi:hypothetical protein
MPQWHNLVLRKTGNLVSSGISRFKSGLRRFFSTKVSSSFIDEDLNRLSQTKGLVELPVHAQKWNISGAM